jgi:glycosyltransferase involved in cell wall biosynthesis
MISPIVSVIMLTYNRQRYLPEAIQSVLSQTFQKLELLILDDGSTDNTEALIHQIDDERIRYFKFDHTAKASRLRNFGINSSNGQFIAFIDSDDIWSSEKIQMQADALNDHATVGYSFTDVIEFANDGTVMKNGIYPKIFNNSFEANLFGMYVESKFVIYPSSLLFRKDCLQTTGLLNELFSWTDNDFFHRLAYHYNGFFINQKLVRIRKHDENTSSKFGQETVTEMLHMLKSFHTNGMIDDVIFRKMAAHYHYLSGISFLRNNDSEMAKKAFVNCTRYDPINIKAWIRITLCRLHVRQPS